MFTIICGEDNISSRNYYTQLKKKYKQLGFEIKDLDYREVTSIKDWLANAPSLFHEKRVYFTNQISKKIRKDQKNQISELQKIADLKSVELYDWEGVSAWEIKIKKIGKVKEFKADITVFRLLDSVLPGKKNEFIDSLYSLKETLNENFIFIMLVRHIRKLILVKSDVIPAKTQPWQINKLKNQASSWKPENLLNFYQGLFKIEEGLKTGNLPYSIKESLEILACHYL